MNPPRVLRRDAWGVVRTLRSKRRSAPEIRRARPGLLARSADDTEPRGWPGGMPLARRGRKGNAGGTNGASNGASSAGRARDERLTKPRKLNSKRNAGRHGHHLCHRSHRDNFSSDFLPIANLTALVRWHSDARQCSDATGQINVADAPYLCRCTPPTFC